MLMQELYEYTLKGFMFSFMKDFEGEGVRVNVIYYNWQEMKHYTVYQGSNVEHAFLACDAYLVTEWDE